VPGLRRLPFEGKLTRVNPSVDPARETFEVEKNPKFPTRKASSSRAAFAKARNPTTTPSTQEAATVPLVGAVHFCRRHPRSSWLNTVGARAVPVTLGVADDRMGGDLPRLPWPRYRRDRHQAGKHSWATNTPDLRCVNPLKKPAETSPRAANEHRVDARREGAPPVSISDICNPPTRLYLGHCPPCRWFLVWCPTSSLGVDLFPKGRFSGSSPSRGQSSLAPVAEEMETHGHQDHRGGDQFRSSRRGMSCARPRVKASTTVMVQFLLEKNATWLPQEVAPTRWPSILKQLPQGMDPPAW